MHKKSQFLGVLKSKEKRCEMKLRMKSIMINPDLWYKARVKALENGKGSIPKYCVSF